MLPTGGRLAAQTMNTTLIFVATVVFSFVVGRGLARLNSLWTLPAGMEYVAIGVLLGPVVPPTVLSKELLHNFDLLVSMILGIVGFAVGLGVRQRVRSLEICLAGGISTFLVIAGTALAALLAMTAAGLPLASAEPEKILIPAGHHWASIPTPAIESSTLWLALTLGAVAGTASGALARRLRTRGTGGRGRMIFLDEVVTVAQVVSILTFGAAMAGARATTASAQLGLTPTEWIVITLLAGATCGVLFSIFIGNEDDEVRTNVAIVGAVTFASGMGAALGVSPLLMNLVAGMLVSATSNQSDHLEALIIRLRRPCAVMIFLLCGAHWAPVAGWLWLFPIGYVLVRWVLRIATTRAAVLTFMGSEPAARSIGSAMGPHGVLACAIALAYVQRFPEHSPLIMSTVLGGIVISDMLSIVTVRRYLANVGLLRPVADRFELDPATVASAAERAASKENHSDGS